MMWMMKKLALACVLVHFAGVVAPLVAQDRRNVVIVQASVVFVDSMSPRNEAIIEGADGDGGKILFKVFTSERGLPSWKGRPPIFPQLEIGETGLWAVRLIAEDRSTLPVPLGFSILGRTWPLIKGRDIDYAEALDELIALPERKGTPRVFLFDRPHDEVEVVERHDFQRTFTQLAMVQGTVQFVAETPGFVDDYRAFVEVDRVFWQIRPEFTKGDLFSEGDTFLVPKNRMGMPSERLGIEVIRSELLGKKGIFAVRTKVVDGLRIVTEEVYGRGWPVIEARHSNYIGVEEWVETMVVNPERQGDFDGRAWPAPTGETLVDAVNTNQQPDFAEPSVLDVQIEPGTVDAGETELLKWIGFGSLAALGLWFYFFRLTRKV